MLKSINPSDSRQKIRDDIINEYRDRIAQNIRSKLSKHERFILADSFIDLLGYCQSEENCRILCEAEIALLEEGYPKSSIANQYLPEWRNWSLDKRHHHPSFSKGVQRRGQTAIK